MSPATEVKGRPLIMSAPMVRAVLDGSKTQTRRIVKPQPIVVNADTPLSSWRWSPRGIDTCGWGPADDSPPMTSALGAFRARCPYGAVGDRLWIRETWADTNGENGPMLTYRAGGERFLIDESYPVDYSRYPGCTFSMWGGDLLRGAPDHSWRSPIHMPRWASRLTLEITDVRVERVTAISNADCEAEGITDEMAAPFIFNHVDLSPLVQAYRALWNGLNFDRGYGFDSAPWVWVIGFRRVACVSPTTDQTR